MDDRILQAVSQKKMRVEEALDNLIDAVREGHNDAAKMLAEEAERLCRNIRDEVANA